MTYTIGSNPSKTVPDGIFNMSSSSILQISPKSLSDVGVYDLVVKVTDPYGAFGSNNL